MYKDCQFFCVSSRYLLLSDQRKMELAIITLMFFKRVLDNLNSFAEMHQILIKKFKFSIVVFQKKGNIIVFKWIMNLLILNDIQVICDM